MVTNVGGAGAVQMMNIEGLDLESMLMAVQTNRVNLMDQQLKDQMEVVQGRNNRINELNTNMNGMNAEIAKLGTAADAKFADQTATWAFHAAAPKVTDPDLTKKQLDYVASTDAIAAQVGAAGPAQRANLLHTMIETGYVASKKFLDLPTTGTYTQAQKDTLKAEAAAVSIYLKTSIRMVPDPKAVAVTDRASAEAYVKSLTSEIDALGNSQQMDMLRLQSLSNKRNEAFEIMTNFMKKLADSRSGIIQKF